MCWYINQVLLFERNQINGNQITDQNTIDNTRILISVSKMGSPEHKADLLLFGLRQIMLSNMTTFLLRTTLRLHCEGAGNCDSSVGVATGLRASIFGIGKRFFFLLNAQTGSGARPSCLLLRSFGGFFPRFNIVRRFWISRAIHRLPHTHSWCEQRQVYFNAIFYMS
jgi:hypothetical protein